MPVTFPTAKLDLLGDVTLLNRAVYGGDSILQDPFLDDFDPAIDPSNAGIRPALNVYDRYDTYLAQFGIDTLDASDLGFDPADVSTQDDLVPGSGDGNGIDQNYFYIGDLYRNHTLDGGGVFDDAAAVALAAVKEEGAKKTLHLVFRGTDADFGADGEAGSAPGLLRYYAQLKPLIDQALAFAQDPANGITDVAVSGHSLGGAMVDMFTLYDAAAFQAVPGLDVHAVAIASSGLAAGVLALDPSFDATLVDQSGPVPAFQTPDFYSQLANLEDIVRFPGSYDAARHAATEPAQAVVTAFGVGAIAGHLRFPGNALFVDQVLLDQYLESVPLDTTFLAEHFEDLYEIIGQSAAEASRFLQNLNVDAAVALGGKSERLDGVAGPNNVNSFTLSEDDNFASFSADDTLIFTLSGDDTVRAGFGDDAVIGGDGDERLAGRNGDDLILGFDGDDLLVGGNGDDRINGGEGDDRVVGNDGDDLLLGGRGNDAMFGGDGDDVIAGGGGDDRLTGNGGADRFVYTPFGNDLIADFEDDVDVIDLTAFGLAADPATDTAAEILAAFGTEETTPFGTNVLLSFPRGTAQTDTVRVLDTTLAELENDILF